jgi:hypothetical protein
MREGDVPSFAEPFRGLEAGSSVSATTPLTSRLVSRRPGRLCSRHWCLGTDSGDGYRSIPYFLPVPESGTSCGLPSLTLSVIARVAVREPVALGVNVTAMVHFSLGASELGQ